MTPHIGKVLGGFHHRVASKLTGRQLRRGQDSGWVYTPLEYMMAGAGLQEMEIYISRRHNTVAKFLATRTIMDLCLAAQRRPGSRLSKRWWDQDGLDLEGMRTADQEAEYTAGEEETDGTETEIETEMDTETETETETDTETKTETETETETDGDGDGDRRRRIESVEG